MKYSKRDREMAAVRCQFIADWWFRRDPRRPDAYEESDQNWNVRDLCVKAYEFVSDGFMRDVECIGEEWAEAEALIRTGWSPS